MWLKPGLFKTRIKEPEGNPLKNEAAGVLSNDIPLDTIILNLKNKGKEECENNGASIITLRFWLEWIKANMLSNITDAQRQHINNLEQEIIELKGKIESNCNKKEDLEDTITEKEVELNKIKAEINRLKNGGELNNIDSPDEVDKLGYFMGCAILIALTFYLVLFYISIIYNAWVLDIQAFVGEQIEAGKFPIKIPSIVNLKALPATYIEDGFLGAFFVIIATSLFIALGYLMHKFQESKQQLKGLGILLFTLFFDAVLAYEIVSEVYNAKYNLGQIPIPDGREQPIPWNFWMIFSEVPFYIIICAGFAAYLIWGIVLNFIFKEREKMQPENLMKRKRNQLILNLKADSKLLQKTLDEKKQDLIALKTEITRDETIVKAKEYDKERVVFNPQILRAKIYSFSKGWCEYIMASFIIQTANSKVSEVNGIVDGFLQSHLRNEKNSSPSEIRHL